MLHQSRSKGMRTSGGGTRSIHSHPFLPPTEAGRERWKCWRGGWEMDQSQGSNPLSTRKFHAVALASSFLSLAELYCWIILSIFFSLLPPLSLLSINTPWLKLGIKGEKTVGKRRLGFKVIYLSCCWLKWPPGSQDSPLTSLRDKRYPFHRAFISEQRKSLIPLPTLASEDRKTLLPPIPLKHFLFMDRPNPLACLHLLKHSKG